MTVGRPDVRLLLMDAFGDLASRMPVGKITVKQIAAQAGVSTRAFYNYFSDKYDLMGWSYGYQLGARFQRVYIGGGGSFYELELDCLNGIAKKCHYIANMALTANGRDSVRLQMRRRNAKIFEPYMCERMGVRELDPAICLSLSLFLAGTIEEMLDWCICGMAVPAEDLARWITDSIPENLRPYLDRSE